MIMKIMNFDRGIWWGTNNHTYGHWGGGGGGNKFNQWGTIGSMVLVHGERCWGTPKRTLNTLRNNKFKPLHKQKKFNYTKMIF
jgi:hypothetical protein